MVADGQALLDQVPVQGGEVEVGGGIGGDRDLVVAMVGAHRSELRATRPRPQQPGAFCALLGPAALWAGQADVDLAVRGGERPADLVEPAEGGEELVPKGGVGLLGGVG